MGIKQVDPARRCFALMAAGIFHCVLMNNSLAQLSSQATGSASSQVEVTPESLEFRRQATRRMIFDRSQDIPLAGLDPAKTVGFDLMYPPVGVQDGETSFSLSEGRLKLSTVKGASAARWVGGFNPFATYDLTLSRMNGDGRVGLRFGDSEQGHRLSASIVASDGVYRAIQWVVTKSGKEVDRQEFPWPKSVSASGPVRLRVQMLAVGVNLYIESQGRSQLVGYPDFVEYVDVRHKDVMRRFEFCLLSDLAAEASAEVANVTSALTPGCGQADIRAITNHIGEPLLDEGRLWLTLTVRGRALPHPLQGVFSMNPSVFDIRFEGIIVFDIGDGLLRNELASHLFFDEPSGQWRGWTTGFSALGTKSNNEEKAILAVSSDRDPRRGFSIMHARSIGLSGQHEDPHGIYDSQAGKWRLLLSEHAGKYRAGMWESEHWDRGYERLAGPVEMDSTGTLIQKISQSRYVFFGSADRRVYIRSYPELNPVGELKIHRPPWNDTTGTRIWPNIIPLPDGYPARYIALMMDRQNYPDMPARNWTYGAMCLYYAH